jgi:hypothetical protein
MIGKSLNPVFKLERRIVAEFLVWEKLDVVVEVVVTQGANVLAIY